MTGGMFTDAFSNLIKTADGILKYDKIQEDP